MDLKNGLAGSRSAMNEERRPHPPPDRASRVLLKHEALIAVQAARRLGRRPSDLGFLLVFAFLVIFGFLSALDAAIAREGPRHSALAILIVWVVAWKISSVARSRLNWFAEETPFSGEALTKSAGLFWTLGTALLVAAACAPLVAWLAVDLGAPIYMAVLALVAMAGGILQAAVTSGIGRRRSTGIAATGPDAGVGGERLFREIVAWRQIPLGRFEGPRRLGPLPLAGSIGLTLGLIVAAASSPPAYHPVAISAVILAIAALFQVTRIDRDVAVAASTLGFGAGRVARAYLAVPTSYVIGFLAPLLILRPSNWAAALVATLGVAAFQSLQGLLRLWRGKGAISGIGAFVVQLEVAAYAVVAYLLPPAGPLVAGWRLYRTARRHDASLWIQD